MSPPAAWPGSGELRAATLVTASPALGLVLVGDAEGRLGLWRAQDGAVLGRATTLPNARLVRRAAFAADGQLVAVACDEAVTALEVPGLTVVQHWPCDCVEVAFDPGSGQVLATCRTPTGAVLEATLDLVTGASAETAITCEWDPAAVPLAEQELRRMGLAEASLAAAGPLVLTSTGEWEALTPENGPRASQVRDASAGTFLRRYAEPGDAWAEGSFFPVGTILEDPALGPEPVAVIYSWQHTLPADPEAGACSPGGPDYGPKGDGTSRLRGQARIQLPAGRATPSSPALAALGACGVDLRRLCDAFNAECTAAGVERTVLSLTVTLFADGDFRFLTSLRAAAERAR